MESFMSQAFIPLLMAGGLIYYAVRILQFGDTSIFKSKGEHRKFKDEKAFAKNAAYLMIFLACVSLLMIPLLFVSAIAAFAEVILGMLIFAVLWRRMDKKYGYQ